MRSGDERHEIKAFDQKRRTNSQLMVDCNNLGYLRPPIFDLTYGKGAFWHALPDMQIEANDLDTTKGTTHYDFAKHPGTDNSYGTVIFDPPYRMGGTLSTPTFDHAYGLTANMNGQYVKTMIEQGTAEALRLARHYVLVKVQDHISGGKLQPLTTWAINAAERDKGQLIDSLHVVGGRSQPKNRKQKRARHGYSTLLVLKAPN